MNETFGTPPTPERPEPQAQPSPPPLANAEPGVHGGPPPGWNAPRRPTPPPRPKSSLPRVLLVLFGLFVIFICFIGGGLLFLMHLIGGASRGGAGLSISFGDKIGLLRIEGEIMPGANVDFWLNSLREMGRSSSVRGVVLRINSPGGSVGASQELQSMVLRLRNQYGKPVYVSMGDVAASGGYYIAAGADEIFALKGTLTGSIGVLLSKPDLSKLVEKLGIDMETVKSGRFKDAGGVTRSLTENEREMFDNLIMNTYHQFLDDILNQRADRLAKASKTIGPEAWAEYRFEQPLDQSPEHFLTTLADGRAYTGEQALQLGLVDQIGTLDDTIRALADRLRIAGWPKIEEASRRPSLFEMFDSKLGFVLPSSQSPLQYRMQMP